MNNPAILAFDGRTPAIAPDAWVAPGAVAVGDVTLLAGSSVWYNAVLRGDRERIEVGQESNLQDAVVVHADVGKPARIGSRVSVGHGAILHGCHVGDDVLIGMGSILLNGSRVGSGTIIAAGTVIREGSVIPPGALVAGVPGSVRRMLTQPEKDSIRENAQVYLELSRQHAQLSLDVHRSPE